MCEQYSKNNINTFTFLFNIEHIKFLKKVAKIVQWNIK